MTMATSHIYSDCACSINPINFGYPTIRSTTRTVVSRCCMNVIAVSTTCCDVSMFWKFSDSILRRSLPQVNTNIRLHVVMGFVITSIAYSNSMNMGTCCIGRIGICAITITTTRNTSVRFVRTTKGKCV